MNQTASRSSPSGSRTSRQPLPSFAASSSCDPRRTPDWRWLRSQELWATGRRLQPQQDDAVTRETVRYLRGRARCRTDRQRQTISRRYASIEGALALYEVERDQRILVEAHILTGRPIAEIARAANRPCDVMETYEALFFDIRDRLQARIWILLRAIGRPADAVGDEERKERLVKLLAHRGGPVVLDAVLRGLGISEPSRVGLPHEQSELLDRRVKLLQMLMSVPLTPYLGFALDEIWRATSMSPPADLDAVLRLKTSVTVRDLFAQHRFAAVPPVPPTEIPLPILDLGKAA